MKELLIKRSDGLEEFEKYLRDPSTFQKILLVPSDLDDGGGVGTSVAYCQFLLTWARMASSKTIKTYLNAGDVEAFGKFTERAHGVSAAYFSEQLIAAANRNIQEDIRFSVLRAARPRFEAMNRGNLLEMGRGREIEFIFVQDTQNQFHSSIYAKEPTPTELMDRQKHGELIRPYRELNRLLELCFGSLKITKYLEQQIKRTDFVFGALLSEIFRNTAEHGFLDIRGGRLKLNLRCIRIAVSEINREKLAQKTISSSDAKQAAQRYFTDMAARRGEYNRENVRLLELSVFDSGPGFASTIEKCDVSDNEQARQAVVRCFLKHESAKLAPRAGQGLSKVLGLLNDLGGFVRVRTSKVEAFYGGRLGADAEIDPNSFVHSGLAQVEGSVVTICIPITY